MTIHNQWGTKPDPATGLSPYPVRHGVAQPRGSFIPCGEERKPGTTRKPTGNTRNNRVPSPAKGEPAGFSDESLTT